MIDVGQVIAGLPVEIVGHVDRHERRTDAPLQHSEVKTSMGLLAIGSGLRDKRNRIIVATPARERAAMT
jgi:hypothetical protein